MTKMIGTFLLNSCLILFALLISANKISSQYDESIIVDTSILRIPTFVTDSAGRQLEA